MPGRVASGVGRSPPPDRSSFGACGQGPLPTGCECGGCGRADPSSAPQRALLRAGFACCGGGTRAPGGGASCLGVGRLGSGALQPPTARPLRPAAEAHYLLAVGAEGAGMGTRHQARLLPGCGASGVGRSPTLDRSSFGACCRGPLPTGRGCGGCGHGDPSPTPQRALLRAGFARCGGGTRAPGGGASCLGVGRPGLGALPPPTARPLGRAARDYYRLAVGAEGAGDETRHHPHSARSWSWLCVLWGRHEDAQGGHLLPGRGASRVGCSSTPDRSSFGACCRGPPPTGCECGGCGCEVSSPTRPGALLQAGFARCGGGTRAPRGGAPLAWAWNVQGRAISHTRPLVLWGVRPGPTTDWLWVRRVRATEPVTNPTARALGAGFACCGGGTRAPGGATSWLGLGRPGSGALPPPTARPLGRAAGAHYPLAVGAGGASVGTRQPTHSARSCELAPRCGGGTRAPGGAPLVYVWGVLVQALSQPPTACPLGRVAGARYPLAVGAVCRRGGPAVLGTFSRAAVRRLLCVLPRCAAPGGVVAWHLSSCRGCGRRRASLACLLAPRWCAVPRPVRLLSVLWPAFPSPWCLPPTQGLSPPALLGGCAGHVEAG